MRDKICQIASFMSTMGKWHLISFTHSRLLHNAIWQFFCYEDIGSKAFFTMATLLMPLLENDIFWPLAIKVFKFSCFFDRNSMINSAVICICQQKNMIHCVAYVTRTQGPIPEIFAKKFQNWQFWKSQFFESAILKKK